MKTNHLHNDGLGSYGLSVRTFAERNGMRVSQVIHFCRLGRLTGARKHPYTKQWWIYPPAKLVLCAT